MTALRPGDHTGSYRSQLKRVAAVQRKLRRGFGANHLAQGSFVGLDRRNVRRDFQALTHLTDFQTEVGSNSLIGADGNGSRDDGLETALLCGDGINAGLYKLKFVVSRSVGCGGVRFLGTFVLSRYAGGIYSGSGSIGNVTHQRGIARQLTKRKSAQTRKNYKQTNIIQRTDSKARFMGLL